MNDLNMHGVDEGRHAPGIQDPEGKGLAVNRHRRVRLPAVKLSEIQNTSCRPRHSSASAVQYVSEPAGSRHDKRKRILTVWNERLDTVDDGAREGFLERGGEEASPPAQAR